MPLEQRAKISAANRGRFFLTYTPELREKRRVQMLGNQHLCGHRHSAETRAKQGAAARRLFPNHTERLKAGWLRYHANAPVIGECAYCGAPAVCMDHIIPKSRGGTDAAENRAPACADCNWSKWAYTVEEWFGVAS